MNLKKMPIKYFSHYMLRSIKKKDYKDMFDYGKKENVTKTLTWGPMVDIKEAKDSIKEIFLKRPSKGIPVGYAIIDLNLNKMIGTIDFHTKVEGKNIVEIGYALHDDYWNQHIMTKALKIIVEVGFQYYQYDALVIKHLKRNVGSGKVIQKNGFEFVKSYPYTFSKDKKTLASVMYTYQMTKERYHEIKSRKRNI